MYRLCLKFSPTFVLISLFLLTFVLTKPISHQLGEEEEKDRPDEAIRQEIARTKDLALGYVPKERLVAAYEETERIRKELKDKRAAIPGVFWEERGPSNVGGRTRTVIFDKNDNTSKTVWAGSVGGGLWKTNDITVTAPVWQEINPFFANLAITSIAQDPTNFNILYFGTGEGWYNGDAIRGNGIWKSTDGGTTWTQLASTNVANFNHVQKVVVDNTGNVYACTRANGLQKSTNGGTTWTKVLGNGVSGGANNACADFEIAANGDLYCSFGIFNAGSVFKSAASNGANTGNVGFWTAMTLPAGTKERIELACAPSNSNVVYALFDDGNSGRAMKTTNGGTSWANVTTPSMCDQGTADAFTRSGGGNQAWYDLAIAVDPSNENTVYVGGVDGAKSTNGGTSWANYTSWTGGAGGGCTSPAIYVHADIHTIVFQPGSNGTALWGCDGGVFYATNMNTATPTFAEKNSGYNVTQFYACAVNPTLNSNNFLAGAQDNGTHKYSITGINSTSEVTGGDGGFCHIDQDNPNTQITSYTGNSYTITTDNFASANFFSSADGDFINPTDYDNTANILYCANLNGQYKRMTVPAGAFTAVTVTAFGTGFVTHVYVSPNVANRVYFGLDNGDIVRVDNAHTGTTIAGTLVYNGSGSVSGIAVEQGNENHMLITYSNYGLTSAFESVNATAGAPVFASIEGNLPDMPIRWVIFSPLNNDMALIATEIGVWSTDNLNGGATNWQPSNEGLANVRTDMLQFRTSDNLIAAATHGRGLFTTMAFAPFNQLGFVNPTSVFNENAATTPLPSPDDCLGFSDVTIPVKVTKRPVTSNATVNITVDPSSTATQNIDFELLNTTLTFSTSGAISQNVTVRIYNDDAEEGTETIVLNLSTSHPDITAITTAQHTITLFSDDYSPIAAANTTVTLGAGTVSFGNAPFRGIYEDEKTQIIYTVADLTGLGMSSGTVIGGLGFNVLTKGSTQPYNGFTLKLGHTAANTLTTAAFQTPNAPGFTTVFTGNHTTFVGWNMFNFQNNFVWNGTSNLLLEVCFDNNSWTNDDAVQSTGIGAARMLFRRDDGQTGCSMGVFTGSTSTSNNRPNTRFIYKVPAQIQTAVNPGVQEYYLGPNQTVHFYDNTGNIMATVQNTGSHDFGCTKFEVDRAGTSALPFWYPSDVTKNIASKTFRVTPENNNLSASYNLTLYYTSAEISGWMTATGNPLSSFGLLKVTGHDVSEVTPTTPYTSDVTLASAGTYASYNTTHHSFTATFSGFSGFGGGNPGPTPPPLPLSLMEFDGNPVNQDIHLFWETQDERDCFQFEIQRTSSGNNFQTIANVSAKNQTFNRYEFTDRNLNEGWYSYRLKMIDNDGLFSYSGIKTFSIVKNWNIGVLPNPFHNEITIASSKPYLSPVNARLTDSKGSVLYTNTFSPSEFITFSTENLPQGIYLLKVISEYGEKTEKVMK